MFRTELKQDNLILRPFDFSYAEAYCLAAQETAPYVYDTMPWCHLQYQLFEAEAWIQIEVDAWDTGKAFGFVIFSAETEELIGAVDIYNIQYYGNFAELGYWIRHRYWGQGIATKAAALVAQYGFQHLPLKRLEFTCLIDNYASHRVAEKIGAKREGILRQRTNIHGEQRDIIIFSVLPEELIMPRLQQPA